MEELIFRSVVVIGIIVVFIVCLILCVLLRARCPKCRKYRALILIDKEAVSKEKCSKIETLNTRDGSGKIIRTREHRIYGEKICWRETYQCKYCNHIHVIIKYEEKY